MDNHTVLVLSNPAEPLLKMLAELPDETTIVVGETAEAFERAAPDADVLYYWWGPGARLREVFLMCPKLKWVHTRSAGIDNLLFPELIESPVPFTNGTGVFSESLGEFALGAILYFAKDFRRMVRNQMAGRWEQFDTTMVSGKTVGIVGYGDIGRAVASRCRAVGMRVIAMKRHGSGVYSVDPMVDKIYTPAQMAEMLPQCDYVVISAPLTAETKGMINEAAFAAMKPEAVVINIGRGALIDEPAMIRALGEGRIKGAGLDVFAKEPLPDDSPLYKLENVLLSPHSADHTPDWQEQTMRFFIENFQRYSRGEPLRNVVDKKLGY